MNDQKPGLKLIASYLPQFHPIPENDEWWGKGFTEWTNVVKARPLFRKHKQPHLPSDLGFCDLRLDEVRQAQARLARDSGIYGFCYYHYWFNGKRLLERPFNEVLESGQPDFPFMLCWANENWTRTWDGLENTILVKQEYGVQDAALHAEALLPAFSDSRYIRINGRPVFVIYRSTHIPAAGQYIDIFRSVLQRNGIELYLCRTEYTDTFGKRFLNPGFDAAIEFQPFAESLDQYRNGPVARGIQRNIKQLALLSALKLAGRIEQSNKLLFKLYNRLDYNSYVEFTLDSYSYPADYLRFPAVTPSWDNSPRKGDQAFLFKNANPDKFGDWLKFHFTHFTPPSPEENLLFINAWNEWGEGNHLEPCQQWGTRYLKEIKKVTNRPSI
jgi:lipopolysaccharide biosynthesis protein